MGQDLGPIKHDCGAHVDAIMKGQELKHLKHSYN